MQKPRKIKNYDKNLTEILDIDGVLALEEINNTITIVNSDTVVPLCERCLQRQRLGIKAKAECRMKNHGTFYKDYYDVIKNDDGSFRVVTLHYKFYKYICLDEECPTVYQKPIDFARENAHVTKRFEDTVVYLACFMSFSMVSDRLMYYRRTADGKTEQVQTVSKQAVKEIVDRWTESKNIERGELYTPSILGLMKFGWVYRDYVLAFDAGSEDLRIIEVFPKLDRSALEKFLMSLDLAKLTGIVTDCEPVLIETAETVFYKTDIMVSVDAIMHHVLQNFRTLICNDAAHITVKNKDLLLKNPTEVATKAYESQEVRDITERYLRVGLGYDYTNRLRAILSGEWDATDVLKWSDEAPDEVEDFFSSSSMYIKEYWDKMLRYYMRRNEVSGDLYQRLLRINRIIEKTNIQSDSLFKSRILYIPDDYNESVAKDDKWYGVPYEKIITALKDMRRKRRTNYERTW